MNSCSDPKTSLFLPQSSPPGACHAPGVGVVLPVQHLRSPGRRARPSAEPSFGAALTKTISAIWAILWVSVIGLVGGVEAGAEPGVDDGAYLGRRIAHTMHWKGADWLVRTERAREESTGEMLDQLRLKAGDVVCDLGCGNGYHTLVMAERVAPDGTVYAVDIQPEMLELLKERARDQGVSGVVPRHGSATDPRLPEGALDLVLLVDVYHEFSHPVEMLAALHRSLKPDGLVVLVEFRAEDETVPIKPDHKMSRAQILKELTANGFVLARSYDALPWQHMLFFRRASESDSHPGGEPVDPAHNVLVPRG